MVEVHERYVRSLEQDGTLNRELEFLPTDEGFDERQAAGGGLTAPEFAILLSHTKIALGAGAARLRPAGGPVPLERARALLPDASRRGVRGRSCSATRCGARSSPRGSSTTSSTAPERPSPSGSATRPVPAPTTSRARTPWRARSSGCAASGREIEALDGRVPAATQIAMLLRARILLERATRWLLRNRRRPLDIAAAVARYAAGRGGARRGAADAARPVRGRGRAGEGRGVRGGRRSARARAACRAPRGARTRRSTSSRSQRRPRWTWRPRRRSTSRSARGSSCTGCATGSSTFPGRRAGRRWRAPRSGTTSTPSRPA